MIQPHLCYLYQAIYISHCAPFHCSKLGTFLNCNKDERPHEMRRVSEPSYRLLMVLSTGLYNQVHPELSDCRTRWIKNVRMILNVNQF